MSNPRIDIIEKKDILIKWLSEGKTKSEISLLLKCKRSTLDKYFNLLKLEVKHEVKNVKSLSNLLKDGIYIGNTNNFKYRLIKEGFKIHKCEKCNREEWEGDRIPIELHHIDGDRSNNLLNNLQILCPNCHTQTDNYKSKKIKESENISSNYCVCGNIKSSNSKQCIECYSKDFKKGTKNFKSKKRKYIIREFIQCEECKCEFKKDSNVSKFCSKACMNINKSKHLPSKEQLIKDFEELKSFVQVGKKYNVSDNSIRKWCRKYQIA